MSSVNVDPGVCIAFGGSNARIATCHVGEIEGFEKRDTPLTTKAFFRWAGRGVLEAAHAGNSWVVASFPGVVSPDGTHIGPMKNVEAIGARRFNLLEQLNKIDPAIGDIVDSGFKIVAVNDGTLSAQAAASRVSEHGHDRTAALIIGTGVGAGVVTKDRAFKGVHRVESDKPYEIGHVWPGGPDFKTYEDEISGTALAATYGSKPEDLPIGHKAWVKVSRNILSMSTLLADLNGVNIVVPCGGVGAGESNKYLPNLRADIKAYLDHARKTENEVQIQLMPEIVPAPAEDSQIFEMFGAEGVMRDFLSRKAA